jgi:hypothetical protein
MSAEGDTALALAAWLTSRGTVSLTEWDHAVWEVSANAADPRRVLRLFEVGFFAAAVGEIYDTRVSVEGSALLRCSLLANVGFLVGPEALADPSRVGSVLGASGIELEEQCRWIQDDGGLIPPVICCAASEPSDVARAAEALGVEFKEPAIQAPAVEDFTAALGAADETYLRSDDAYRWNHGASSWVSNGGAIRREGGRPGVFRARLASNLGNRLYLRCLCTGSSPARLLSENAIVWAIWHSAICPSAQAQTLSIREQQSWLVEMWARTPLPLELARAMFVSAGAFPSIQGNGSLPQRIETWRAVDSVTAARVASAVGIPLPSESSRPGWPRGSRPLAHLTF